MSDADKILAKLNADPDATGPAAGRADTDPASTNGANPDGPVIAVEATIVTLEQFAADDEPGADPLLGDADGVLIPEGGDVMLYGDGGTGKTTLSIDLACHLAAGEAWLEVPVPRPVRVLLIENEGPRPMLRRKLRRKLEGWTGAPLDGRVHVFEDPWALFTFAADAWRTTLAAYLEEREIDVVIAGPLTRIGMDDAGTLQQVGAFHKLVADVRDRCHRRVTVILVHHENKGGAVSGAWEGSGDTLLHVQKAGPGRTVVAVQKARWDSERHGKVMHLAWEDGEGFELEANVERDLLAEVTRYLREHPWRTVKEIAASANLEAPEVPGIGANDGTVKAILEANPEVFEMRTKDAARAVGRAPNAKVFNCIGASDAPDAVAQKGASLWGAEEASASLHPPLKDAEAGERTPGGESGSASASSMQSMQQDGTEHGLNVERSGKR